MDTCICCSVHCCSCIGPITTVLTIDHPSHCLSSQTDRLLSNLPCSSVLILVCCYNVRGRLAITTVCRCFIEDEEMHNSLMICTGAMLTANSYIASLYWTVATLTSLGCVCSSFHLTLTPVSSNIHLTTAKRRSSSPVFLKSYM